jgi:hypothetical protein
MLYLLITIKILHITDGLFIRRYLDTNSIRKAFIDKIINDYYSLKKTYHWWFLFHRSFRQIHMEKVCQTKTFTIVISLIISLVSMLYHRQRKSFVILISDLFQITNRLKPSVIDMLLVARLCNFLKLFGTLRGILVRRWFCA